MPDLNVVAILEVRRGLETEAEDALQALVAPTRSEPECISYDLDVSEAIPGTFVTIGRRRTQEELVGHMETPHIREGQSLAGSHLIGEPRIHPLRPL